MSRTSLKIRGRGICSRMANLTRHLVSSASLRTAGKIVFWNDSNPMTLCRVLMVLMTLRRTSAHSSLRKPTKRGNKCSFVFSGPIIDANFIIVEARAVFTGWCGSSNALRVELLRLEHTVGEVFYEWNYMCHREVLFTFCWESICKIVNILGALNSHFTFKIFRQRFENIDCFIYLKNVMTKFN